MKAIEYILLIIGVILATAIIEMFIMWFLFGRNPRKGGKK